MRLTLQLIRHLGVVSSFVHVILDILDPPVRQQYVVPPVGYHTVASLFMAKIISALVVLDVISEVVLGGVSFLLINQYIIINESSLNRELKARDSAIRAINSGVYRIMGKREFNYATQSIWSTLWFKLSKWYRMVDDRLQ